MKKFFILTILFVYFTAFSQHIQQQLVVTQNDGTVGGLFKVAVQMKATNLTGANTLNGTTIDVQFDTTQLSIPLSPGAAFTQKIAWHSGIVSGGYTRSASRYVLNNITYIRIAPSGSGVDGVSSFGWDLTTSYQTVATITFAIKDNTVSTSLSIFTSTNGCKLFDSEGNSNATGGFTSPTLDQPTTGISNVLLPVEITSFTAAVKSINSAILTWSTATEVNNSGFAVERRAVGSESWQQVGFVTGAGTSSSTKEYTFQDAVAPGDYVYRLKQIDNTGTFKYSATTQISVGAVGKVLSLGNYPNPFNPTTQIQFSVPEDGNASLRVYNMLGQEVATLYSGMAKAGHYIPATFNASRLASGIYLSRLEYNGKSIVQRMLLAK